MWRWVKASFGCGLSLAQKILLFAAFFCFISIVTSSNIHATDASWNGDNISYDGKTFSGPMEAKGRLSPLPKDLVFYFHSNTGFLNDREIEIIYSKNNEIEQASELIYVKRSNTGELTDSKTIQISQKNNEENEEVSTCQAETAMSWVICPVTQLLGKGADVLFAILGEFLEVKPLEIGSKTPMYHAWKHMQSFANIAFLIAFLIIIYSQITGGMVSNYSLKRLLPRLIIAAILVNVSFIICAIAIDISNILGFSLQSMFTNISNDIMSAEYNGSAEIPSLSWSTLVSALLAGGGVIAGIGLVGAGAAAGISSILGMLLLGVVLSALTVVIILAVRQALIVICVILAPLAFVAYLLPNTESWFKKWQNTFASMLFLFPVLSFMFGGAKLASTVIIGSATSIPMLLLGMTTQLAPLVLVPFVIRSSNNILGKVASALNKPKSAAMGKMKNWSKDRWQDAQAKKRAEQYQELSKNGKFNKWNYGKRSAIKHDRNRRHREMERKSNEELAGALFAKVDHRAKEIMIKDKRTGQISDQTKQEVERGWQEKIQSEPVYLKEELRLKVTTDKASLAKARLDNIIEEAKAGHVPSNALADNEMTSLTNEAQLATRDLAIQKNREQMAKIVQQKQLADSLFKNDDNITIEAGGIRGEEGARQALSNAISIVKQENATAFKNAQQILEYFKVDSGEQQKIALGGIDVNVTTKLSDGSTASYTLKGSDNFIRSAAIEHQVRVSTVEDVKAIVQRTGVGLDLHDFRDVIADALPSSTAAKNSVFLGGKTINDVILGSINGEDGMNTVIIDTIKNGKYSPKILSELDAQALKYIKEAVDAKGNTIPKEKIEDLRKFAATIIGDPSAGITADPHLISELKGGAMEPLQEFLKF